MRNPPIRFEALIRNERQFFEVFYNKQEIAFLRLQCAVCSIVKSKMKLNVTSTKGY